MNLGEQAPGFSLEGTDGNTWSLADFAGAKALVVVFSCNHCPYVQAYEERLVALQRDYPDARLVAINSNDASSHPEDGFDAMVERAKSKRFNFPYLRDESQAVARAYGATHTPHLFVFDGQRRLAYTGKIDDNWQDAGAVKQPFLREALDDLLAGRAPRVAQTHALGCTIKWKR